MEHGFASHLLFPPCRAKTGGQGLALRPQSGRPSPTPSTVAGPWHPVNGRTGASIQKFQRAIAFQAGDPFSGSPAI